MEEIVDAVRRIESDYAAQSKAAHDVAREYFASDVVLPKLVADIGL
jgi:hypothetical protein